MESQDSQAVRRQVTHCNICQLCASSNNKHPCSGSCGLSHHSHLCDSASVHARQFRGV